MGEIVYLVNQFSSSVLLLYINICIKHMRERDLHLKDKDTHHCFWEIKNPVTFRVITTYIHILNKIFKSESQFITIPKNFPIYKPTVFIKLLYTLAGFFTLTIKLNYTQRLLWYCKYG